MYNGIEHVSNYNRELYIDERKNIIESRMLQDIKKNVENI